MKASQMRDLMDRIIDQDGDIEITLGPEDNPVQYVYIIEGKRQIRSEYQATKSMPAKVGFTRGRAGDKE